MQWKKNILKAPIISLINKRRFLIMFKQFIYVTSLYLFLGIMFAHDMKTITYEELQEFETDFLSFEERFFGIVTECAQSLDNQELLNRYRSDEISQEEKFEIVVFCLEHNESKIKSAYKKVFAIKRH